MQSSTPEFVIPNPPAPEAEILAATDTPTESRMRNRVLWLAKLGFTLMFAVWLMFGVLAIPIRKELHLTEMQFGWLTAIAILNGSLWRLMFGILTDRYGGRLVTCRCWLGLLPFPPI